MLRIRKERKLAAQRKAEEAARKAAEKAAKDARGRDLYMGLMGCCASRVNSELKLPLDEIAEMEHELRDKHKKVYKNYKKRLEAFYLKTVLPARYKRLSCNPVQDRVVFMEKNGLNSAPNGHISRTLAKQSKYQVIKMGLNMNGPSRIGYYENCVKYVEEIATAKAVFISSSNTVLSQFDMRPETKLIQLWHGLGMFKKCGFSTIGSKGLALMRANTRNMIRIATILMFACFRWGRRGRLKTRCTSLPIQASWCRLAFRAPIDFMTLSLKGARAQSC